MTDYDSTPITAREFRVISDMLAELLKMVKIGCGAALFVAALCSALLGVMIWKVLGW